MRLSRDSSASMSITGKRATSPPGNAIVFRHDALTVEYAAQVHESTGFLTKYLDEHSVHSACIANAGLVHATKSYCMMMMQPMMWCSVCAL